MEKGFQIDSTDRQILDVLSKNARMPYLEVARMIGISGAAVHQRMQKMLDAGIVRGSHFQLDPGGLGYFTCAFIGIRVSLTTSTTHQQVYEKIREIPEIVECHHTSGNYSLFVKIFTRSNEHLKKIIVEKIQTIAGVNSTETFISLEKGFQRQLPVREGNVLEYNG